MLYLSRVRDKYATLFSKDGSAGSDRLFGAALSDDGSVVLAGVMNGNDFAAVKLDVNGTKIWIWQVRRHLGHPELAG